MQAKDVPPCHYFPITELKVQANVIRQEKEIHIQIGKEDIQLFLFIDDMIVYVEKPKKMTIKIISNDSKVEGFQG